MSYIFTPFQGGAPFVAIGQDGELILPFVQFIDFVGATVTRGVGAMANTVQVQFPSGAPAIDDEGINIVAAASTIDFQGAGVVVTDGGDGTAVVTIPGTGLNPPATTDFPTEQIDGTAAGLTFADAAPGMSLKFDGPGTAGTRWGMELQAATAPITTATYDMKVLMMLGRANDTSVGFILRNSSNARKIFIGLERTAANGVRLVTQYWNAATTLNTTFQNIPGAWQDLYLRVVVDATEINTYYSLDGENYILFGNGIGIAGTIQTIDQAGFGVYTTGSNNSGQVLVEEYSAVAA